MCIRDSFDLATLSVKADLKLSSSHESGPPLLWIAVLGGRLNRSLAATSGVETAEQRWSLQELGCDVGQGYYFGRPGPPTVLL